MLIELVEAKWRQIGFICGSCGYLEFYVEEPEILIKESSAFFESTEAAP